INFVIPNPFIQINFNTHNVKFNIDSFLILIFFYIFIIFSPFSMISAISYIGPPEESIIPGYNIIFLIISITTIIAFIIKKRHN
ncbi:MAG: hypothetical protein ACFFBT_15290, partial [Promethearchaeota archaeon]